MAPQSTATKGRARRAESRCRARATSSLPVPVSPSTSTVASSSWRARRARRPGASPGSTPPGLRAYREETGCRDHRVAELDVDDRRPEPQAGARGQIDVAQTNSVEKRSVGAAGIGHAHSPRVCLGLAMDSRDGRVVEPELVRWSRSDSHPPYPEVDPQAPVGPGDHDDVGVTNTSVVAFGMFFRPLVAHRFAGQPVRHDGEAREAMMSSSREQEPARRTPAASFSSDRGRLDPVGVNPEPSAMRPRSMLRGWVAAAAVATGGCSLLYPVDSYDDRYGQGGAKGSTSAASPVCKPADDGPEKTMER